MSCRKVKTVTMGEFCDRNRSGRMGALKKETLVLSFLVGKITLEEFLARGFSNEEIQVLLAIYSVVGRVGLCNTKSNRRLFTIENKVYLRRTMNRGLI